MGKFLEIAPNEWPKWDVESSYNINSESSGRHWAWEFLRRNPEYQKLSAKRKPGEAGLRAGREFGRLNLKSYKDEYGNDDTKPSWFCEAIPKFEMGASHGRDQPRVELLDDEVAIVINLNDIRSYGRAVMEAQFYHAKQMVLLELEAPEKFHGPKRPLTSPKPRRDKFLVWLRVYDAINNYGVDKDVVAETLYQHLYKGGDLALNAVAGRKQLNDDLRRATEMVKKDYLTLVPGDYSGNEYARAKTSRYRPPAQGWPGTSK